MLSFANFGKKTFVGFDFGTSVVKVVELSYKSKKIYLENYGSLQIGSKQAGEGISHNATSFDKWVGLNLKKLVERMKLKSKEACVAIPGYHGLVAMTELPKMGKKDLEQAVQFEAHKYIPSSLDDVFFSWDMINTFKDKDGKEKTRVVLVAAPKKEVIRYEGLVSSLGLKVNVIELEMFSMARALVGNDSGTHIIVDIGARTTNVILYERGAIRINRNVDVGGFDMTNTIADNLNVSRQRAEALKKEKSDILNSREMPIVIPSLDLVMSEVSRILNAYKGIKLDSVILSGGSAKLKGVSEYFSKKLGITTVIGNPWKRIIIENPALNSFVKSQIGSSFTVAIGLALRGIDELEKK